MTDKELRRLSRAQLLELMLEQAKELEAVKKELEEARSALKSRDIDLDEAGSIAVAALRLNGIFEVAQLSAQQYIDNIKRLSERQDVVSARREEASRQRAEEMLRETERKCAAMEEEAKKRAEGYWAEVAARLQAFYENHQELKRLLDFSAGK